MKYMLQIYGNITREQFAGMSEDERNELYAAWGAVNQTPGITPGMELADPATATTVRVRDGKTLITDGPFAETHEQLGGFFLLECKDLDEALRWAEKIPHAKYGSVEVRPLWSEV